MNSKRKKSIQWGVIFTLFMICCRFIPDKLYIKVVYRYKMGRWIDWDNPETFNDKLQWMKLYNRRPEYTMMVDKYAVKEYVKNKIGEQYVVPNLFVWDRPEDIDFDMLPDKFVIKTTHDGGSRGCVICKDKQKLNRKETLRRLKKSMKNNLFYKYREWPYKNVKKRIIAEKFLENEDSSTLNDYKLYCFNGLVKCVCISNNRFLGDTEFDYFDDNFNRLPFSQGGPNSKKEIKKPQTFDEMKVIAEKLSSGIPHVRVDLYEVKGHVYFGELTFFDSSGFKEFIPEEWDYKLGSWLELPEPTT
ncbi:ATP-grasp fold amidoligase family protein [Bacteroides caecigallinarum]|uniref:ATP-grasp fold amidoligase family protein n=1 Tax=Bacteroides caecigallinarum TaxID=1411144 RepID=UPI00195F0D92|nr:ATP-grasp fold amidoligase family protein [Bacteroides caecigallinarum]